MDVLSHHFIRLGLTRAKALQTASRFPRETHRRFAVPKSNAFTLWPWVHKKRVQKSAPLFRQLPAEFYSDHPQRFAERLFFL